MKKQEKLEYIQNNHFAEWLEKRTEVLENVSAECGMLCVCGKLCTGLHESYCKKFQNKVTVETLKRLDYLIKGNEKTNKNRKKEKE